MMKKLPKSLSRSLHKKSFEARLNLGFGIFMVDGRFILGGLAVELGKLISQNLVIKPFILRDCEVNKVSSVNRPVLVELRI
jgi:hypothetical protein